MNWLKHRRFWEALAVVALALVLWNGGDLLSFGESHPLESPADRVAAILVLIAAWGLLEAIAGAMLLARSYGDATRFAEAAAHLLQEFAPASNRRQRPVSRPKPGRLGRGAARRS